MAQGSFPGDRFQILSLDGGGYKGVFSAAVLAGLEDLLHQSITQYFDLIAGTSTGGIIALGLGAGLAPRDIVEFYAKFGPRIFRGSLLTPIKRGLRPKYDPRPLKQALQEILGERYLADSVKRLVITAYDLGTDQCKVFKTPHHQSLVADWSKKMVDVAMATAAAPTYFPAYTLNKLRLVDGGVWANNPVLVAISEAISKCGASLDSLRVLSLGTTTDLVRRKRSLDNGGMAHWAISATDVILRGQSDGASSIALHLLRHMNYLRVDPHVAPGWLTMDSIATDDLAGLAEAASPVLHEQFMPIFGGHRAPAFDPLYTPDHPPTG